MTRNGFITLLVVLVLTALVQSVVIVRDTEKAILLKLGAFERTLEPGLNFKIPFIDTVTKFEARIRSLDTPPDRVLSSEAKPLNVDSFVKYRIVDAETYYTSTNGGQSRVAEDTLQRRIKDKLRNEFGKRTLIEVVSGDRDGLMLALKNSLGEDSAESSPREFFNASIKPSRSPETTSMRVRLPNSFLSLSLILLCNVSSATLL